MCDLKSSLPLYWKLFSLIASCNTIILSRRFIFTMISFHLSVSIVSWTSFFVWWCLHIFSVLLALSTVMSVLIYSESSWITLIQNCSLSLLLLKRNKFNSLSKSFIYKRSWINHRIMLNKRSCVLLKSLLKIMMR